MTSCVLSSGPDGNGNLFTPLSSGKFNSYPFIVSLYETHDRKNPEVMSRFEDRMGSSMFKGGSQRSLSTIKSDTAKFRLIR